MKKIRDFILFLIYKTFKFFVLKIPKKYQKLFLDKLSLFIYKIDKHKLIAFRNLDLVFKDSLSFSKKEQIVKNSYKNLLYSFFEFLENQTLPKEKILSKIKSIENEDILLEAFKSNKKIIIITAHYGNWELLPLFVALKYNKEILVVGRQLNNIFLQKELITLRKNQLISMTTKDKAAKDSIKALRNNKILGLVIDQHIDKNKGQKVEFLGLDAIEVDSSARLALKFDAIIIPMFCITNDFQNYTISIKEPIKITNILDITKQEAKVISEQILAYPDIWFWQHKRFKEFYKY